MTVSSQQQLDLLWKKLGHGVAKTDTTAFKDATNESISSSPFIPSNRIWSQSFMIPAVLPAVSSALVEVHSDALSNSVACTMDITATDHRTWLTGLRDWVPIQFGSTYLVKIWLDNAASITPQTTGIQLFSAGSDNNDEWFFDYESGVLNFIGDNLPPNNFVGKKIFVTGARYIGPTGLGTFGNMSVNGSTITSLGDIILIPAPGNVVNMSGAVVTNVGYSTNANAAATTQYVVDQIAALHSNIIYQGDSIVRLSDPTGNSAVFSVTLDNQLIATMTSTTANIANLSITGNTVTSQTGIVIRPGLTDIISIESTTALKVPAGTTLERPSFLAAGEIRFNTTTHQLEWYNGTEWVNAQVHLTNQKLIGDGVTDTFTLDQSTSTNNVFVMINGVVSVPVDAYNILGTSITFVEPPKVGDNIEIRYLTDVIAAVSMLSDRVIVDPAPISIGTTLTNIDSFDISLYRAASYLVIATTSDGNTQYAEITVIHNGTSSVFLRDNNMSTGGSVAMVFSTSIAAGHCILSVICSTNGNFLKLQSSYTTV